MFKRSLVAQLIKRLVEPRRFIQIIEGPRQSGKTTAVLQALEDAANTYGDSFRCHYVSADEAMLFTREWVRNEWQRARALAGSANDSPELSSVDALSDRTPSTKLKNTSLNLVRPPQITVLAIDEIQKIDQWSSIVKQLWDEDTRTNTQLKVVLTGSSALLLQKGLAESLHGRFEVLYSHHWNFAECRAAFGYSLEDFLFYGGYPGAASLIVEDERWARYMGTSIVEPTLSQDILMMEEVRKPALLRALFMLGSQFSAQELSFSKLLGQLQDAGNTVTLAHYLDLLGKARMLIGLQKYSPNKVVVRKSSPRLMVFDTSLMTFTSGSSRRFLLENPRAKGHLVESAVGAYLLARSKEDGFEVYWWRERADEVDFVIQKGACLTAVEVKSGRNKNVNGSLVFKKLYPEALSLVVGSAEIDLEAFLLGKVELFL